MLQIWFWIHYMIECLMKKKKEGRWRKKAKIQQLLNSNGEVEKEEETTQMAFMVFGDNEVTSSYLSLDKNGNDNDSLKDSYAKNKELKIKINALLSEGSRHFQENKMLNKENDDFKKLRVDIVWSIDDLKKKLEERIKFYEKIKEEQNMLRKRMDKLNDFLRKEKQ